MPASAREKMELINKGMEMVSKHSVPSPETKEALDEIKIRCANRGTELALMRQDINTMKESMNKVESKVDKFDEKLDTILGGLNTKYANKWVENAILWGGMIVMAGVLTALMSLILK